MLLIIISCSLLININVVLGAKFVLHPKDIKISAGNDVTFTCGFEMSQRDVLTNILWDFVSDDQSGVLLSNNSKYKIEKNKRIKGDVKYINTTMKIINVNHNDTGDYVCSLAYNVNLIIYKSTKLTLKRVPEPLCMDLPTNIKMTDSLKLSCMIGPGNYVTKVFWYEGNKTEEFIDNTITPSFLDTAFYFNTTVKVDQYEDGTTFSCIASGGEETEKCTTNPLNIMKNQKPLDVKVESIGSLPVTAGSKACFQCNVVCKNGSECIREIKYIWKYDNVVKRNDNSNIICLHVTLNDKGKSLRCIAETESKQGSYNVTLHVVEIEASAPIYVTETVPNMRSHKGFQETVTTKSDIYEKEDEIIKLGNRSKETNDPKEEPGINTKKTKPHNNGNNNLQHLCNKYIITGITTTSFILGCIGVLCYYKCKKPKNKPLHDSSNNLFMSTNLETHNDQNSDHQNDSSLDFSFTCPKFQRGDKKKSTDKNNVPIGIIIEKLDGKLEENFTYFGCYGQADENNRTATADRSPVQEIDHWESPSGDIYACVKKNKPTIQNSSPNGANSKPCEKLEARNLKDTTMEMENSNKITRTSKKSMKDVKANKGTEKLGEDAFLNLYASVNKDNKIRRKHKVATAGPQVAHWQNSPPMFMFASEKKIKF